MFFRIKAITDNRWYFDDENIADVLQNFKCSEMFVLKNTIIWFNNIKCMVKYDEFYLTLL